MYSVCFAKHILECGVIVLYVLEEPLLGELRGDQGLFVGLDVSLLEVAGVGHITCQGAGVVKRVHTLFGGVHRLATALKEVEEVREEVQEIKDVWEDEEVEKNGGLNVEEKRSSHAWLSDMRNTLSHAVQM